MPGGRTDSHGPTLMAQIKIPPWADLPQELLSAIARSLSSKPIDILRFRSVCKSWYSASLSLPTSLLSPPSSLTLPRPPFSLGPRFFLLLSTTYSVLSATTIYALHPPANNSLTTPKTWLLFSDHLNPRFLSLRQHLTGRSFSLPLDFPRKLNLLDFRVSEIGHYYNFSQVCTIPSGKLHRPNTWSEGFLKVVLLSNGSGVFALSEGGKLGLLRFVGGERNLMMGAQWEIVHDGQGFCFDDILEYRGRFLGIDRQARMYEIGHDFLGINKIVPAVKGESWRRKRLIESSGFLFLAVRFDDDDDGKAVEMGGIKIYKLNELTMKWNEVKSIGEQIFFFGIGFSFSASAKDLEGFRAKNCILYEVASFQKYGGYDGDSWLFRGLGYSRLEVGVYHLEDGARLHPIESYPSYSDILWPPPTWIWLDNRSKLLGILEAAIDRLRLEVCDDNLKANYEELSSLVKSVALGDDISQQDMQNILKAKYGELSSVVGFTVLGDGISQEEMLNILKESDILKKFMNKINLRIYREFKGIAVLTAQDVSSRQTELSNQVDCLQNHKGTQDSISDYDLFSRKLVRRAGAHIQVRQILSRAIKLLEENVIELKDILEYREEALAIISTTADEMPSLCDTAIRKAFLKHY